jgi:hypothetical protein
MKTWKTKVNGKAWSIRSAADRHGQPLLLLEDLPGNGCELRAADLRALAQWLETIADDVEGIVADGPVRCEVCSWSGETVGLILGHCPNCQSLEIVDGI